MPFIILLLSITLIGVFVLYLVPKLRKKSSDYKRLSFLSAVSDTTSYIIFLSVFLCMFWYINYLDKHIDERDLVVKYNTYKETLSGSRLINQPLERVAVVKDIIALNIELSHFKDVYKRFPSKFFFPQPKYGIDTLKLLK